MASKMTPEPVAVPVPVWPVVGSVSVTPSATIVTTAGLTALTMSTTDALEATSSSSVVVVEAAGVDRGGGVAPGVGDDVCPGRGKERGREDGASDEARAGGGAPPRRSATDGRRRLDGGRSERGGLRGGSSRRHRDPVRLRFRLSGGG